MADWSFAVYRDDELVVERVRTTDWDAAAAFAHVLVAWTGQTVSVARAVVAARELDP